MNTRCSKEQIRCFEEFTVKKGTLKFVLLAVAEAPKKVATLLVSSHNKNELKNKNCWWNIFCEGRGERSFFPCDENKHDAMYWLIHDART